MAKCSYEQKPFRREVLQLRCSGNTITVHEYRSGKKNQCRIPGTTGSLGCAISEVVEARITQEALSLCTWICTCPGIAASSIIGMETMAAGQIWCKSRYDYQGGGSNLGGLISPFAGEMLRGKQIMRYSCRTPASLLQV